MFPPYGELQDVLWSRICLYNKLIWDLKEVMSSVAYVLRTFKIIPRTEPPRPPIGVQWWNQSIPKKNVKLLFDRYQKLDAQGKPSPTSWNEKAKTELIQMFEQDVKPWIIRPRGESTDKQKRAHDRTIVSMVKQTWSSKYRKYCTHATVFLDVGNYLLTALLDTGSPSTIISKIAFDQICLANPGMDFLSRPTRNHDLVNATGDPLKAELDITLPFQFSDSPNHEPLSYDFTIGTNLTPVCLLGRDFLTHFRTIIVTANDKVFAIQLDQHRKENPTPAVSTNSHFTRGVPNQDEIPRLWIRPCNPYPGHVNSLQPETRSQDRVPHGHLPGDLDLDPTNLEESIQKIVKFYPDVFSDQIGRCKLFKYSFHVKDPAKTICAKPYPIPRSAEKSVDEILDGYRKEGIIVESYAPHRTNLVCVPKANGEWRICGDYRELNKNLIPPTHEVPRLETLKSRFTGKTIFSALDMKSAFLQIELS